MGRSHEGQESKEGYTIQIRSISEADIRQTVADLRTGWADHSTATSYYPWLNSPLEELTQGDGVWLSKLTVAANRKGKPRDSV